MQQLVAISAFVLTAAAAGPAAALPLTTESQLEDSSIAAEIETFWSQRVVVETFTGARGLTLRYARALQPDRALEKGALVIVSGRTESMLKYKELVRDLWADGWSVYVHDHRGQGLSDREPEVKDSPQKGHVNEFQDYVADLRSFVASQVLPDGHSRHVLLAHSMGGAIAALFLEQGSVEARRFDAAALSSPMLKIKGIAGAPADLVSCRVAKFLAKREPTEYVKTGTAYVPKPYEKNEYTQSPARYSRLISQYASEPHIQLGSPTHRWFDQACEAAFRARRTAGEVRTPIRIVVAGEDSIVHNTGAAEFCRRLPAQLGGCGGPSGGPIVVPGARHELLIERDDLRQQALMPILQFFSPHN